MIEDRFTTTEEAAGRYDHGAFPQPGPPPRPAEPDPYRPIWACGHLPVRENNVWKPWCAGGMNCPNGGWPKTE